MPSAIGILAGVVNNVEIKWRLLVTLEEYPDVPAVQLTFATYKMKACNRQLLNSKY